MLTSDSILPHLGRILATVKSLAMIFATTLVLMIAAGLSSSLSIIEHLMRNLEIFALIPECW
jgi:hypothetical protein